MKVTLPETNIAMENPPVWWYLPGKMEIFMGYVSFREGKLKSTVTCLENFTRHPDLMVQKSGDNHLECIKTPCKWLVDQLPTPTGYGLPDFGPSIKSPILRCGEWVNVLICWRLPGDRQL